MKNISVYLMLVCLVTFASGTYAQTGTVVVSNGSGTFVNMNQEFASVSKTINELAGGIDAAMMKDKEFVIKDKWKKKSGRVGSYGEAAKLLNKLGNNIKPEAFVSGFSVGNWMGSLKNVKDMGGFNSAVSQLVGGMKDSAFTRSFAGNKASWLASLGTIKQQ